MKLNVWLAIPLLFVGVGGLMVERALSQQKPSESTRPVRYETAWKEFLGEISAGDSIEEVQKKLKDHALMSGYVPLGGSGAREWVFRIDDANEIVMMVDPKGEVFRHPQLQPARKWFRYPDGSMEELRFLVR